VRHGPANSDTPGGDRAYQSPPRQRLSRDVRARLRGKGVDGKVARIEGQTELNVCEEGRRQTACLVISYYTSSSHELHRPR
jgi:hypothetical protein